MSLAQSISHALGGKTSGKGYRIPAFWRDSTDLNIYIADGADGGLIAADHSHGDEYKVIMQALEDEGFKPKSEFKGKQRKDFLIKKTKRQLRDALQLETHIALQFLNDRAGDIVKASDPNYLKLHPEFVRLPDELMVRERLAYTRIIKIIGQIL